MTWLGSPADSGKRAWPTPQDYNEALQNPATSFEEPELRRGRATADALGIPKPITGNFATVYRVQSGKAVHAVRCFLRSVPDQEERYALISRHLADVNLPQAVEFQFLARGIRVKGSWYPILKMDWVQGTTLSTYVEQHLDDRRALNRLAEAFVTLLGDLQRRRIAHGDLQHGNLLVVDGRTGPSLRLIDYDGMWVPALDGRDSAELGHVNYQHPRRSRRDYGSTLDSFSAWVILAALLGTRADPAVWSAVRHAAADDRLLLGKADYLDVNGSPALRRLAAAKDAAAQRAVERLIALCPPGEHVLGLPAPSEEDLRGGKEIRWLPQALAPLASAAASAGQDWWRSRGSEPTPADRPETPALEGGATMASTAPRTPGVEPMPGEDAAGPAPAGGDSAGVASIWDVADPQTAQSGLGQPEAAPQPMPAVAHSLVSTPWQLPAVDILTAPAPVDPSEIAAVDDPIEARLTAKLQALGIEARITDRHRGPNTTVFNVQFDPTVSRTLSATFGPIPSSAPASWIHRLQAAESDLAMAAAAGGVRVLPPVPGGSTARVEVVTGSRFEVNLRTILTELDFAAPGFELTFALGRDVRGLPVAVDLGRMPHLLVAGATGSGKSVMLNALISSFLCTADPDKVRLLLVDTARVEFAGYNGLPHLLSPVLSNPPAVVAALQWAVGEMQGRFRRLAAASVRDIGGFNQSRVDPSDRLPRIVVVVDDYGELRERAPEIEDPVVRLSGEARAAGIHLVLSTHRPSVDVVNGLIKANFRSRIAFRMASQVDSLTVLDAAGAEHLLGAGDMLYQPLDVPRPVRLQGVRVADADIYRITQHWRAQAPDPLYPLSVAGTSADPQGAGPRMSAESADPLLPDAVAVTREYERVSASLLQRRLRVGYARAAQLIDQLEERGYVGAFDGSNARIVLRRD